jgi:acetyltransferase-like isoleucine patch superfamily enzyme
VASASGTGASYAHSCIYVQSINAHKYTHIPSGVRIRDRGVIHPFLHLCKNGTHRSINAHKYTHIPSGVRVRDRGVIHPFLHLCKNGTHRSINAHKYTHIPSGVRVRDRGLVLRTVSGLRSAPHGYPSVPNGQLCGLLVAPGLHLAVVRGSSFYRHSFIRWGRLD